MVSASIANISCVPSYLLHAGFPYLTQLFIRLFIKFLILAVKGFGADKLHCQDSCTALQQQSTPLPLKIIHLTTPLTTAVHMSWWLW